MTRALAVVPLLIGMLAASVAESAQADNVQTAAKGDPVFEAMQAEMERSKSALKLETMAAPYYIDYRMVDMDSLAAEATFGSLSSNLRVHARFLRVVVRVGDYKQDSFFGQGTGTMEYMPLDDDLLTLRHQIWLATDKAYKEATAALAAKQAQLKQYTVDQPVDDFAHAEPVVSIKPLAKLEFGPQPWLKMLRDGTSRYKSDPQVDSIEASLKFSCVNRYFLNSEGTAVRSGQTLYEITLAMSTQAADGMRLDRSHAFVGSNIAEMPREKEFLDETSTLLHSLKDLREAPVVDDEYRGPLLFSGDAAADTVSTLVGENVLGIKPGLGQPARTTGAYATSYHARVLPEFLSVVDDPTLAEFASQPLLGKYDIDDEGVRALPVTVIENGKLINYLLGRHPIRDFPASNGHGRAKLPENYPGPSLGNLIVRTSEPVSNDELRNKLIELCRQRDLPYGYYVETLGPKLTPRLLYKVWVKDGHEELVRGATFGDLDTRAMRNNLVAAGDTAHVASHLLNIPHSIVSPALLFDELEVKRADVNKEKLPDYPAPTVQQKAVP